MRVLFLGMNYAPEETGIGPFTTGLCEFLQSRGNDVVICTAMPHFPQWEVPEDYHGYTRRVDGRNGVEVRRSAVCLPKRRSVLRRILYDTSFAAGAFVNSIPLIRPDVIVAISPPAQVGYTGALLARRWGAPLVLLVKDLPTKAAAAVGMLKSAPVTHLGSAVERVAYRLADQIVVISDGFHRAIVEQGIPAERIVRIPDWADTETITPVSIDTKLRGALGASDGDFLLLHAGNMGAKQGLDDPIRAALSAPADLRLKLAVVGDGLERVRLEQLVDTGPPSKVKILPLMPRDQLPGMLSAADALLINQRADVVDSVAPSKLLTYMAAGRPVLAAVNRHSEASRLVEESGCGMVVRPEDPESLLAGVDKLRRDPRLRETMGRVGRSYVERHYARSSVLNAWESMLTRIASSRPHGHQ